MARGIKLNRLEIRNANHLHLHGFRIRIEVAEVNGGMDRNVFVYQRKPADPYTGETSDVFCSIASFVDLAEYPAGAPDAESGVNFFRKDVIELDVRSLEEYEMVWSTVRTEVCRLIDALNKADELELAESLWCGDEPVGSEASESMEA